MPARSSESLTQTVNNPRLIQFALKLIVLARGLRNIQGRLSISVCP